MLEQVNAPIKQISTISIIMLNNSMLTFEYQAVNIETISTKVDKITNGKLRLWLTSNKTKLPTLIATG